MNAYLSGLKSTEINDSVDMLFLGDGYNHTTNDGVSAPGFYAWAINGSSRLGAPFDFIHNNKKNLVFVDGHVEAKTRSFVQELQDTGIRRCSKFCFVCKEIICYFRVYLLERN